MREIKARISELSLEMARLSKETPINHKLYGTYESERRALRWVLKKSGD